MQVSCVRVLARRHVSPDATAGFILHTTRRSRHILQPAPAMRLAAATRSTQALSALSPVWLKLLTPSLNCWYQVLFLTSCGAASSAANCTALSWSISP